MTQHATIEIAVRTRLHEVRRLARLRADGVLDREAWLEALELVERLERDAMHLLIAGFGGGGAGSAPLVAAEWQQVGPAPIRERLGGGPAPVAGRVYDVAIDPRGGSDQTIYGATVGGIWKSLDGGVTWAPKTDRLPWNQMGAVALDPANPDIVYAGGIFGPGPSLFRSVDGGETWSTIGGPAMLGADVVRIVLPAPGVVLVGTFINGVYRSVNDGANFGSNAGTYDNNAPILGGLLSDLRLDTNTPTTVYACMEGVGIFKSTDAGATFPTNLFANPGAPAAGTYNAVTMAQSIQPDHHTLYATASTSSAWVGLFKSTNDGGSWTLKPAAAAAAAGGQFGFDQTIGVDPQNAMRLYLGFQDLHLSTDGGDSFAAGSLTGGKVHSDHHAVTFSPQSHWGAPPTRLYVGTDGGTAVSGDGGGSWTNLNEGVATILVGMGGLDIGRHSAANNAYSYAGSQDNGTAQRAPAMPGNDWVPRLGGDGGWVAVDPYAPLSVFGAVNDVYQRSTDGGMSWAGAAGITPAVHAIAVDPGDGSRVYVAGGPPKTWGTQLLQSTDHGASFTSIHTFPAGILSIAPVYGSGGASVWVGLLDGSMWRTDNALMGAGSTWTSHSTGLPGRGATSIAVDPFDARRVMVGYWGASAVAPPNRSQQVYLTTDNGITWVDASGTDGGPVATNLPNLPVYSVAMDPGSSNGLFGITTSGSLIVAVGLFGTVMTSTDGITWTAQASDAYDTLAEVVWTGAQFVVVGLGGTILTSPDAIAWTARKAGPSWEALQGVAWSGAVLVATSASYGTVYRSPDGVTWTPVNNAAPQALLDITWANGQFVAVGYSGTVVTSPDGLTWTAHVTPTAANLVSVVWSGTQYVATGIGTILTSPDGSTWTARVSPTPNEINEVAWSGVRFVGAVNTGEVVTSPDGVTWALHATGSAHRLNAILWSGSEFIAVGDLGTVLTSSDGLAWTDHSIPIVPPALICGNETGVLFSIDDGATWRVLGVGLPTASCTALALDWSRTPSLLRVGTDGRSVFELVTSPGPRVAVIANLGFGKVAVGSSANLVAKVFNAGSTPLSVTGFSRASGSTAFSLTGGPAFPFTLQPGQEQDLTVHFQPTMAGIATAIFHLTSSDPGDPTVSVPMSGTGT